MDETEKRQKQSNLGVLIFIIAAIAGGITVSNYLSASDRDAASAFVIMFYAFSFISLHRIKRNLRKIIFLLSSTLAIGTIIYISIITKGHELQNVYNMLISSIVMAIIVFITLIYRKVKIDLIDSKQS